MRQVPGHLNKSPEPSLPPNEISKFQIFTSSISCLPAIPLAHPEILARHQYIDRYCRCLTSTSIDRSYLIRCLPSHPNVLYCTRRPPGIPVLRGTWQDQISITGRHTRSQRCTNTISEHVRKVEGYFSRAGEGGRRYGTLHTYELMQSISDESDIHLSSVDRHLSISMLMR